MMNTLNVSKALSQLTVLMIGTAIMGSASAETISYSYDSSGRLATVTNADSTTHSYVYENASYPNAMTGLIDENGNRFSTWGYDSQGRATSTTEANGAGNTSLVYNSDGTVTVTDALGAVRTFSFGRYGDRNLVTGISGSQCPTCSEGLATTYDLSGFLSSRTDYNGNVTQYVYDDSRGLETSRTEAYGTARARTITTQWHATYHLPTLVSVYSSGSATGTPLRTTSYTYDNAGNQLTKTITDPALSVSRTWTYTYNSYGQVLTADGPRTDVNDVTTYTYYNCATGYQCGQVQTITDALGHVTTYSTYNVSGQPLTIIDPNSVVTTLTYDARQRLASRTVGTETTSFSYWPTGLLKQVTLPDSSYLTYTYDAAHRLTQIQDADGNKVVYTLDALGNHVAENLYDPSNALARTHSRVFNSLNQLWKDINAAGTSNVATVFGYDNNGNQTTINAPLTRNTTNTYDELNRLKQVTDPANGITQYAYDANDNLTSVTDPRNLVTGYTYNGLGDLITQVSPDSGTTTNTYDSAGNLKTRTDARNKTGTYSYDALNRVTSIVYSDQTLSFSYDNGTNGIGHLTGASDAQHSLSWSYDALGRVTAESQTVDAVTKTVAYSYTNGDLTSLTTPSGQTLTYSYSNGHISSVAVNGATVLNNVLYDPFGPIRQWTWGNGTLTNRTYDQDGKLTQVDSAGLHTYTFDDAFRITGITDTANSSLSWTHGYDSLDRLTNAVQGSLNESWTYDANGNQLVRGGTNASSFVISPTSNQFTSVSGWIGNTSPTYDAAGNMTQLFGGSGVYNDAGQGVAVDFGLPTQYVYNALGQRVHKSNALGTTSFVYDQADHLLGEYDQSGTLIQELVWLGDIPVATIRTNDGGTGVGVFYVHTDHLNAPTKITRASDNAIIWRWDHDSLGYGLPNEDPDGNGQIVVFNLRFPGQYFDSETTLNYNYHRFYAPAFGLFLQSDPIGLAGGSYSTYIYGNNNPISNVDPDGLAATPPVPIPATPAGPLPIIIPPQPAFTPGTKENGNLVSSGTRAMSELAKMFRREPKACDDGKEERCRKEKLACSEMCAEAQSDPNRRHVYGGSMSQCIKSCLPTECGGEPTWKGFINK